MNKFDLIVVIPVFNEVEIIKSVIEDWTKTLDELSIKYQLRVYNDGSTDGTSDVLSHLSSQFENLSVIEKPNSGHGPTILQGYMEAKDSDWIFQTDSDNEISSDHFKAFWSQRDDYDLIIGRRVARDTRTARKLTSSFARTIVGILYGSHSHDVNCPFRLMRTDAFTSLFSVIPPTTFAPNVILTGIAQKANMKLLEVDVRFIKRSTGVESLRYCSLFKAVVKSFWQTFIFRIKL